MCTHRFIADRFLHDSTLGRAAVSVPDEDAAYNILQRYYDQAVPLDAQQKVILGHSPTINPETARVSGVYFLLSNNCTTIVCHAIREGGTPESFFTFMPSLFRAEHPAKQDTSLSGNEGRGREEAARLCIASGGTNPSACGIAIGH